MAGNHIDWTSEQIIENANNWSLAEDVALLNSLKRYSETLLSESESVSGNVDNLLNKLENVSLKLDLTKNEFQSLRNTQFIENRVYEDDETLEHEENKKEEKELTEEEKESAIKESIVRGLKVMEQYFEKIEVAVSDSEEENDKSYILQAKDPYVDRPLPYLVGSQDWYKKWHVGLLPSESESESEEEEEVYSSSDSDEGLPKDRNLGSETSSELDFTNRHTGPVANSTFNDSQDGRREIFHSSDESFDQSNSLPVTTPISNEKFAEQLAAKLGDVISGTSDNLPHVNRKPIKKMNQAKEYGNLFSDEPPPLDDLEDTVLPKSAHEGLFSRGQDLFGDTEDDLFWDQPNKTIKNVKSSEKKPALFSQPDVKSNLKVSKGLFDESDDSSEEDMFDAVEKRKVKIVQPYLKPFKPTVPFVDEQPPEMTPKSDTAPSKKKPVGGVSIFGENANIFGESSGKPGFESGSTKTAASAQITKDIESKSIKTGKNSIKKTSLFDESSDEELMVPKNKNTASRNPDSRPASRKLNLFDDVDDILPPKTQEVLKKPEENKKLGLFDDDHLSSSEKDDVKSSEVKTKTGGLFDENLYQNVDLFRPTTKEIANKTESLHKTSIDNKPPLKKISLFDDDDDFLKEEEDIFASAIKKKGLFDNIGKEPNKPPETGLFTDAGSNTSLKISAKEEPTANKPSKGLFDDLATAHASEISSTSVEINRNPEKRIDEDIPRLGEKEIEKKSSKGLFDEFESSGSSEDLFGGSKNQDARQGKEGNKKMAGGLFEDTKPMNIDVKRRENMFGDTSKEESEEHAARDTRERENLFKVSDENVTQGENNDEEDFFGRIDKKKDTGKQAVKLVDGIHTSDVLKETNPTDIVKQPLIQEEKAPVKESDIKEKIENLQNSETIQQDDPNLSNKNPTDHSDNVLNQSKNDLLGKIRKNVAFLDSDNESSSDDDFGLGKKAEGHKDNVLHTKGTVEDSGNEFQENTLFKPEEANLFGSAIQENAEGPSKISTEKTESYTNVTESPPQQYETPKFNSSENYTMPPPIDLFDPTPPPLDWDAGSDNSGESDTFSLTDGILNRTNLNQSQARSSLFDEAPPSLDVNDSSGIVRDMNATRLETDDSSFYPYASSSRRLSSDIFGEQQSQDSFFLTKNRAEISAQPGSSLDQIPEKAENISSKIENLTPSGDLEDLEESSVFGSELEDPDKMDVTASEINRTHLGDQVEINQRASISSSKDNVRKRASLFEDNHEKSMEKDEITEKPRTSPTKTSPGKLQHNLKINVNALMPGAARPQFRPDVARSASVDEIDKSDRSSPVVGGANPSSPLIRPIAPSRSESVGDSNKKEDVKNFESLSQTEVLSSATKDRVRIPSKRKPSTRRARQEAVRKSMTDFSIYHEENSSVESEQSVETNKTSQDSVTASERTSEHRITPRRLPINDKSSFLKDLHSKLKIPDYVPKKETPKSDDSMQKSEEKPEAKGISLVFDERIGKQVAGEEMDGSKGLFDSLPGETKDKLTPLPEDKTYSAPSIGSKSIKVLEPDDTKPSPSKTFEKEPKPELNIFKDAFGGDSDIFKATSRAGDNSSSKKDNSLFGDEVSNSSDEDLFSSTKKSFRKDLVLSAEKPVKVQEVPPGKTPSIFSEKSDSDGEGELFGGKKIVREASKKASIFDDSDDSGDDLFGSKTTKSTSESGDSSGNPGSVLGTKRIESKNVKIASVKKLENKEVTDFDPLSALQ